MQMPVINTLADAVVLTCIKTPLNLNRYKIMHSRQPYTVDNKTARNRRSEWYSHDAAKKNFKNSMMFVSSTQACKCQLDRARLRISACSECNRSDICGLETTRAGSSRWQIQIWRLAIFRNDKRWTVLQILACALPITLNVTMWCIWIADQHYRLKKSHGLHIVRDSTSLLFQAVIR